jgi:hypothetical protein
MGDAVTAGPIVMAVSLTEQRAYVHRNGILIGARPRAVHRILTRPTRPSIAGCESTCPGT